MATVFDEFLMNFQKAYEKILLVYTWMYVVFGTPLSSTPFVCVLCPLYEDLLNRLQIRVLT